MQAISSHPRQLPDTAAWLLAAILLLGLLGLGSLARSTFTPTQSQVSPRPASANSAHIIPSSWRSSTP